PVAASGGAEGSPAGGRQFAAIHGRAATALSVFDSSGGRREVAGGYTEWTPTMAARGTSIAAVAASPERPYDVVRVDADTGAVTVRRAGACSVVDVADCAEVARALAAEGTADPDRLAIRGGSAGGWTTAASLVSVDVYRCGTIQYPVLDLAGFLAETHDFESRYIDGLVGP